ncbi:MAG: right-handed parallel beta-helix repeat-containing protein, partial [Candidatus Omnitrophica bacterium]|nr:right-handed parallel beta-helix repeat-containing protein [Candidatus Omnitrophota bacterium]
MTHRKTLQSLKFRLEIGCSLGISADIPNMPKAAHCSITKALFVFGVVSFLSTPCFPAPPAPEEIYLFALYWYRADVSDQQFDFYPPDLICTLEGRCSRVGQTVWYVDNSAPEGGNGTLVNPFNTLKEAEFASSAGHTIFVFEGSGTTTGLDEGIILKDNQRLLGEGAGLKIGQSTIVPPGGRPILSNLTGDGISLANNNRISGLDIDGPQGDGIHGNAISGVLVGDVTIENTDSFGIHIEDGTVEFGLTTISNAGGAGVKISGVSSTVTFNSLHIDGTGADGIDASSAGVSLTVLQSGDVRNTAGFPLNFVASAVDIKMPDVSFAGPGINGAASGGIHEGPGQVVLGDVSVVDSPIAGIDLSASDLEVTFKSLNIDGASREGINGSLGRLVITTTQPGGAIRHTMGRSLNFDSSGVTAILSGLDLDGPGISAAKAGITLHLGDVQVCSAPGPGLDFDRAGVEASMNSLSIDGATAEGILANSAGFVLSVTQPGGVIQNTVGRSLSLDAAFVDFNFNGGTILGGGIDGRATGGDLDLSGTTLVIPDPPGRGIDLRASILNFTADQVSITNASGPAIDLATYRGIFEVSGTTTISNPSKAGVESISPIIPATGTISFASLEIQNSGGEGISFENFGGLLSVDDGNNATFKDFHVNGTGPA